MSLMVPANIHPPLTERHYNLKEKRDHLGYVVNFSVMAICFFEQCTATSHTEGYIDLNLRQQDQGCGQLTGQDPCLFYFGL